MIAYLGPEGTFSGIAAKLYRDKVNKRLGLKPYHTFYEVMRAVDNGDVKVGIVPVENSVEGSVSSALDLLADNTFKLKIIQEIDIPINHNLIVHVNNKEINSIISHPQPIAQCQHYLRKNYPEANLETVSSTAKGAQLISTETLLDTAAIASKEVLDENLKIIAENIADYKDNITRFVVVSQHPIKNVKKEKTSIVFSPGLKDKPGGLYEILGHFAQHKINMTKIESRPRKKMLGEYLFFIDFEGSTDDDNIKDILKEIGQASSFFKNLGSYPISI